VFIGACAALCDAVTESTRWSESPSHSFLAIATESALNHANNDGTTVTASLGPRPAGEHARIAETCPPSMIQHNLRTYSFRRGLTPVIISLRCSQLDTVCILKSWRPRTSECQAPSDSTALSGGWPVTYKSQANYLRDGEVNTLIFLSHQPLIGRTVSYCEFVIRFHGSKQVKGSVGQHDSVSPME
jgi:hypothetical protein